MNLEISSINAINCCTLTYMPHASELVHEWMHENRKNQAQLMRDLKLQNHQKLSMFLRGKTRKPDFLYSYCVSNAVLLESVGNMDIAGDFAPAAIRYAFASS